MPPVVSPRQFQSGLNYTVPTVSGLSPTMGLMVAQRSCNASDAAGADSICDTFGAGILFSADKKQPSQAAQSLLLNGLANRCAPVNVTVSSVCGGVGSAKPYCGSTAPGSVMTAASVQDGKDIVEALLGVQVGYENSAAVRCLADNLQPALHSALSPSSSVSSAGFRVKKNMPTLVLASLMAVALISPSI